MNALSEALPLPVPAPRRPALRRSLATLARRRFALTARTPRELVVPLVTPVLFALVIAPALKQALHTSADYESYVAVGTAAPAGSCLQRRFRAACSCSATCPWRSRPRGSRS